MCSYFLCFSFFFFFFFFQAEDGIRDGHVTGVQTCALPILYPDAPKLPFVPGYEVAGDIDAGPKERIGQRVLALTRFGGYSDAAVVRSRFAIEVPPRLSYAEAAAIPVNWLTAWHMLVELGHVKRGER